MEGQAGKQGYLLKGSQVKALLLPRAPPPRPPARSRAPPPRGQVGSDQRYFWSILVVERTILDSLLLVETHKSS